MDEEELHSYVASQPSIVINGIRAAGIKDHCDLISYKWLIIT